MKPSPFSLTGACFLGLTLGATLMILACAFYPVS